MLGLLAIKLRWPKGPQDPVFDLKTKERRSGDWSYVINLEKDEITVADNSKNQQKTWKIGESDISETRNYIRYSYDRRIRGDALPNPNFATRHDEAQYTTDYNDDRTRSPTKGPNLGFEYSRSRPNDSSPML